jgi:shikimate dehydrogenase
VAITPGVADSFPTPIDASTRYCAVLGSPVRHSASPAFQNAGLATLGLNWRYLAFEVRPEDLRAAIEGAMKMRFVGLNLTVPHKLLAMDMMDCLDESARQWGAVNTVRFEGRNAEGAWQPLGMFDDPPSLVRSQGFNTDAQGLARSLRDDLAVKLAGSSVLLLGAGGAGRAAGLKLAAEQCSELYFVNRTQSKAEELAREVRQRYPQVRTVVGYPSGKVDLLLNATSLGLRAEDPLPFDASLFSLQNAAAVYDMIYRPAETRLLNMARAAGCRSANGLGMLLFQGVAALELWTGRPAPVEIMRRALRANIYGSASA